MADEHKDCNIENKNSNQLSVNNDSNIRPFVRYAARFIDLTLFSISSTILLLIFIPAVQDVHPLLLAMLTAFFWIFVESTLLSLWGSTPGKWLLRIKINDENGGKPKFLNALRRSSKVWLFGFGTGYPLISIFTHISGYSDLTKRGITSWDKNEKFTVTHEKIGIVRAAIAIIIFAVTMATLFIK